MTRSALAVILAILFLGGPAVAQAPAPPPEETDFELLDRALAEVYVPEPRDLEGIVARLEVLKSHRQRDARVDAGLSIAHAIIGERRGDAGLVTKALRRAEIAASVNSSRIVESALGLSSLVSARGERRKREREKLLEAALKSFETAAGRAKEDRWIDVYNRGLALAELGRREEAAKALRAAAAEAAPEWRAAVEAALGRTLAGAGLLAEAVTAFGEARAAAPTATAFLMDMGDALVRLGELDRAEEIYAAAPGGARGRAEVRIAKRAPAGVAEALRAELEAATATAQAFALRGEARRFTGDVAGAAADYHEAVKRSSLTSLAHAGLAELGLAQGRTTTAIENARVALALEPRSPARRELYTRALRAAGERSAAGVEDHRTKLMAALNEARAAGRELPAETAARLAAAHLAAGRSEDAYLEVKKVIAAEPEDALALILELRALLGISPSRPAEARAVAATLLDRLPSLHDVHALAAATAKLAGDPVGTRREADRALELEPSDALALGVLGRAVTGVRRGVESLPPPLQEAARGLESADPVVRARAAEKLAEDDAGVEILLVQIEREPEAYVVGRMALLFGAKREKRASPVLCRVLETLPRNQDVARARIVHALGELGNGSALPAVLDTALSGGALVRPAAADAITALMTGLDDPGSVRFQRSLMESTDALRRAIAPTFAERAVQAGGARVNEAGDFTETLLIAGRALLVLGLAAAVFARYRAYEKSKKQKQLDRTSKAHKARASWDSVH